MWKLTENVFLFMNFEKNKMESKRTKRPNNPVVSLHFRDYRSRDLFSRLAPKPDWNCWLSTFVKIVVDGLQKNGFIHRMFMSATFTSGLSCSKLG